MFQAREFYDRHIRKVNIYWVLIIGFIALTFVAGESSLYKHYVYTTEIYRLEREIKQSRDEIEASRRKLRDLHTNREGLERFGREEYLMKKANEDLFIVK
ncbi:MAG: septum formation initiator family protein [Tannerellaceae bacterium]|jgi:cell division protein FtsB|nr:septum formation initiator family protein [Tannerellaceae bacterium]